MTEEYTIRPYKQGDEVQIVKLLEEVFKGWPKFELHGSSLDYWRWKYQENYLDRKLIVVAENDRKIIGVDQTVPMKIKILDELYLTGLGADLAVHKDFRRKGIRNRISKKLNSERTKSGLIFNYAITGNPIVIDSFTRSKIHHRFPLELTQYVRIRDLDLHLRESPVENVWIKKIGYNVLKRLSRLRSGSNTSPSPHPDITIEEVSYFDARIEQFWNRIKKYYDLIFTYDQSFLNWRYCDSRGGSFMVKQAIEEGNIVGFIVLRVNKYRADYPVAYVVDLLTYPNRPDIIELLIQEAVEYFDDLNVNIINFLGLKEYAFNNILNKQGFLDSRRGHFIFYLSFMQDNLLNRVPDWRKKRIHFTYGQLDVV